MKKLIALLVVFGLLVGVVGVYSADAAAKKATKKVAAKKVVKKAAPKKAAPAPARIAPAPPPPPPVAPVPPPPAPVVSRVAPATGGLFGLGINTTGSLGYLSDKSLMSLNGNIVLDDPLAAGSWVGLSANAVKYRVGLGYAAGTSMKVLPVNFDGLLMLPTEWFGGMETYIGGGVNYVVTGTGSKAGKVGIEVLAGLTGDIGLGSKSFVEVGYAIVRANAVSSKGVTLAVGQQIRL